MILLTEVAKKLSDILNGSDSETASISGRPNYEFLVATQGIHFENMANRNTGNNVIPVFIASGGGEYDPVPELKRATFTIPIVMYFPVRFKNDFYNLNDFLVNVFVGQIRNYGTISGKCLSNISVATFGEIQGIDMKEFATWTQNIYQREIDVRDSFLTMSFNLFLTNSASSYIYGNQITYKLQYSYLQPVKYCTFIGNNYDLTTETKVYNDTTYYKWANLNNEIYTLSINFATATTIYRFTAEGVPFEDGNTTGGVQERQDTTTAEEELEWSQSGTGLSNSPIAQQLINQDKYSKNVVNITSYSKSILTYVKNNEFWSRIINAYNTQDMDLIFNIQLKKKYNFDTPLEYTYNQVILGLNENISRGELISFTISFGDKI